MKTDLKALAQNIDNEIVELRAAFFANSLERDRLQAKLHERNLSDEEVTSFGTALERVFARHHELNGQIAALEGVYRQYLWNRAWIVSGGHVHNTSVGCPGFKHNTEVHLLPQCSALTQDEVVELAGERACTHCFPSAPLSVRQQASKLFAPDEEAKAQRAVERASKADEKKVKEVRVKTGPTSEKIFGTVRSAKIAASDEIWWALYSMVYNGSVVADVRKRLDDFWSIASAVAGHRDGGGVHLDVVAADLFEKTHAKFVREGKKSAGNWGMTASDFCVMAQKAMDEIKDY